MMLKPSAGTMFRQSEGRYEAAEPSWARRRTKWLKNLGQLRNHSSSLLDWAHFLHNSWDPRQESGALRRWGPPEKGEALTHHSAAETGLQAMWGWSWCEDIPTSDLWDRWGCWRSSHPSLLPCGLTARETYNSLCSWSQSAESPRSWKEGLPRSFTDKGACLLGAGFLRLQHPPEGARGESSRKDSWPIQGRLFQDLQSVWKGQI